MAISFQEEEDISEINMTPLVDVMLVLLIIFMITVPVMTHTVNVNLPRATQKADSVKQDMIMLTVDKAGLIYWNKEAVTLPELELRLKEKAAQEDQAELRIQGDRDVPYEKVIQVLAAAQRAGMSKLGFMTTPGS